ncbi:hypothetical protein DR64_454 [Paraburkholderia xenovorans LB400]|uniref:Uncharacterized protein n=1 Tax=Paraburkholderia xenovorans (strain LB400) TaxID=266265 RepID=Q140P6_PARXL|nr:hypothetical protein Bxe_A2771 [Paraburkholderia xenovorans LB400]AIP29644.1 hypothetical protein DR64_454 [Paraburkholderia xenovorans LB400]
MQCINNQKGKVPQGLPAGRKAQAPTFRPAPPRPIQQSVKSKAPEKTTRARANRADATTLTWQTYLANHTKKISPRRRQPEFRESPLSRAN